MSFAHHQLELSRSVLRITVDPLFGRHTDTKSAVLVGPYCRRRELPVIVVADDSGPSLFKHRDAAIRRSEIDTVVNSQSGHFYSAPCVDRGVATITCPTWMRCPFKYTLGRMVSSTTSLAIPAVG